MITLHPAAVEVYGAESTSEAVLVALEASARRIDTPDMTPALKLLELRKRVIRLVAGRLIFTLRPPEFIQGKTVIPEDATPDDIAAYHGEDLPEPFDHVVALAARYEYQPGDRPNARGKPVLSASGHPSSLARVIEPVDEMDQTGDVVRERRVRAFQARALATAADTIERSGRGRAKTKAR